MLLKKIKKILPPLLLLIIIGGFFVVGKTTLAQRKYGFEYATRLNLGTRDLRSTMMDIINIVLGFLGVVAIIVMLYGGFVYMTSAGDPNKIIKAKRILINGVIGLGIIFSSWAIVMLILNIFGFGKGGGGGGGGGGTLVGPGALGSGIIQSHYPSRNQRLVPRNTMITVTFKETMDPTTIIDDTNGNAIYGDCLPGPVCDTLFDLASDNEADSVKIFKNIDGDPGSLAALDVTVFTNDNKTFIFKPISPLGSPTEEFWYTVNLKNTIHKADGSDAFPGAIAGVGYGWQFEVSTIIDVTPPQVESIIPYPDDGGDNYVSTPAVQATGSITVVSQPNTYIASSIGPVTPTPMSPSATVNGSYSGSSNNTITVTINGGAIDANVNWSVLTANNNPNAPITSSSVPLGSGLTLVIDPGYVAGNQWTFNVTAEVPADYLRVGSTNYMFVSGGAVGNQINLGATTADTATNIGNKIDEQSIFRTPIVFGSFISLNAASAGSSGNSIALIYNSPGGATALTTVSMTGGQDAGQTQTCIPPGNCDQPRNVVVQINFNEAVNPVTATGQVLIAGGATLGTILDAASFNIILPSINLIATGKNYIAGSWVISNQYRTVEFITMDKCGVNSCGQDVYCLPTDPLLEPIPGTTLGNILIETRAAHGTNLPTADLPFDGIVDMAANSLDGNKNGIAVGPNGDADAIPLENPDDYYNENTDVGVGDNYLWTFWVNSKVDLTPPVIEEVFPLAGGIINLEDPVEVKFSKLMMSSSLKPDSGYGDGRDHLTLIDTSINPVGYWISSRNVDEDIPPDDVPDKTRAFINHTPFISSTNYGAEAGEGLRDLYQNCYMPAADLGGCIGANPINRSCCNGVLSATDDCP